MARHILSKKEAAEQGRQIRLKITDTTGAFLLNWISFDSTWKSHNVHYKL